MHQDINKDNGDGTDGHDDRRPSQFNSFSEIPKLSRGVLKGVANLGFERPSPVQAEAIPALMGGCDVVAEAPSGSGKTAAYAVPSLECVDPSLDETQVLILTPTRVLGEQIGEVVRELAKFMPDVRVASLLSGTHVTLRPSPHVVVAVAPSRRGQFDYAPDKLLDLLDKSTLRLDRLRMLVLDEADDLLDRPEFQEGVRMVLTALPETGTQVGLFSATFTESALATARKITREGDDLVLVHPTNDGGDTVRPAIQHRSVRIGPRTDYIWEERGACVEELNKMFAAAKNIVFVRTRKQLEFLAQAFDADATSSPFTTELSRFRRGLARVLIATDACGRGIDVQGVAVVINFELPTQLEFGSKYAATEKYIQRAGRAGRFGRTGLCITLVDDSEAQDLQCLEANTGLKIEELEAVESLPGFGQTQSRPVEVEVPGQEARVVAVEQSGPVEAPSQEARVMAVENAKKPEALESPMREEKDLQCDEVAAPQQEEKEVYCSDEVASPVRRPELKPEFEHREMELLRQLECLTTAVSRAKAEMQAKMEQGRAREHELLRQIEHLTAAISRAKAAGYKEGEEDEDDISFYVGSILCGGSSESSIGSTSKGSQGSEEALALPSAPPLFRFGKGTIDAAKLRKGECFAGEVVKILRGGQVAFVKFGDGTGISSKDGALRNAYNLKLGTRLKVAVKEVKTTPNRGARVVQVELALA